MAEKYEIERRLNLRMKQLEDEHKPSIPNLRSAARAALRKEAFEKKMENLYGPKWRLKDKPNPHF